MKKLVTLVLATAIAAAHAELTEEQRRVPLEQDSPDPKLAKIVLLAGSVSNKPGQHEYFAGCSLIMNWLKQAPGVWPVMAAEGWPKNEAIFDGAKSIVVYADGGVKTPFLEPARWEMIRSLMAKGVGLVMLHQAVEVPEANTEELKTWLGGVWKKDIGCRGHWDMEFSSFPQHPITRGVTAFSAPFDGWLYNLHFAPRAVPLLSGAVPDKSRSTDDAKAHVGRAEIIAWAYERDNGGRSFAFTGADLHKNWIAEGQRRLVANGILWTARIEPSADGATVPISAAQLAQNFDAKPAKVAKPKAD